MIGPYCRSKFLAERCVLKLAKSGFPAVIVNPTMPIGPCDRNLTPPGQMIRDFLLGKIKGYMDGSLNIVDVRDVAAGHLLAMQKGISGRRYILGGTNLSVKDFFDRLAALSGCPAPHFKIPYFMALAFAYIEEAYANLSGRRPLSSVTGIRLLRRSLIFDSTRTWRQLGHTCYPVDETLKNTVFWHRQKLIEDGTTI
jgi:dihydroflavonol-4-reductase